MTGEEKVVLTVVQMLAEDFGCVADRSELWLRWSPEHPNVVQVQRVGGSYTTTQLIGDEPPIYPR